VSSWPNGIVIWDSLLNAYVVDEIGQMEHGPVDVLIGALCMEEWVMKLDPRAGEIALSGFRRREFTEFWENPPVFSEDKVRDKVS